MSSTTPFSLLPGPEPQGWHPPLLWFLAGMLLLADASLGVLGSSTGPFRERVALGMAPLLPSRRPPAFPGQVLSCSRGLLPPVSSGPLRIFLLKKVFCTKCQAQLKPFRETETDRQKDRWTERGRDSSLCCQNVKQISLSSPLLSLSLSPSLCLSVSICHSLSLPPGLSV